MNLKKAVTEYELFYDLIFAYAIGRISTMLVLNNQGGFAWKSIGEFVMLILVFWTIWTYQTVYANRFFEKDKTSALFLLFDMFWVMVLSQAISADFEATHYTFAGATAILFFSIAVQYYLKMKTTTDPVVKKLCQQLFQVLVFSGVLGAITIFPWGVYSIRFAIYALSILIAAFFPLLMRKTLQSFPTNFHHLTERYSLFTLLLFGEAIIAVTKTISFSKVSAGSIFFFLVILLFFLIYLTTYRSGIDKDKSTAGLVLIHSHFFIFLGLEMSTVMYEFFVLNETKSLFFVAWIGVSLLCFLGGTLVNGFVYGRKPVKIGPFIQQSLLVFAIWFAISIMVRSNVAAFLVINLVFLLVILYLFKRELARMK